MEIDLEIGKTDVEAANFLGQAPQTLRNYRTQGIGPKYYKIGRSVRYKLRDLLEYMEKFRVETDE